MTPIDFESELGKRIQTMRIILLALIAGIVSFTCVAVFFGIQGNLQGQAPIMAQVFTFVGLGFTACNALAYVLVPDKIVQASRRQLARQFATADRVNAEAAQDFVKLCELYQTQMIVGAALLEGTAFLWLIFFMVTGQWFMLGFAVAAALLLALKFPSADSLSRWLAQQQELIDVERKVT